MHVWIRRNADRIKLVACACVVWPLLAFVVVVRNSAATQNGWDRYGPVPHSVVPEAVRNGRLETAGSERDCNHYDSDRKEHSRCAKSRREAAVK